MAEAVAESLFPVKYYRERVFSAYNDSIDFTAHCHDYFEVIIAIDNNFIHTVNGKSYQPKNGDVIILRPSDVHSAHAVEESLPRMLRDIYIPVELLKESCEGLSGSLYAQLLSEEQPPQFHLSPGQLAGLHARLKYPVFSNIDIAPAGNTERLRMIEKAVVTELLGIYIFEAFLDDNKMPDCLVKLLDALQSHRFAQLKIEEMAAELGYSHTYLCKRFSAYFGKQ